MPRWLFATILSTLLFGTYSIFAEKAGKIHGERVNFIIDTSVMLAFSLFMTALHSTRSDFSRVTRLSGAYAFLMGLTSSAAFLLLLYSLRIAPTDKMPVIMIMIGFSTVITAVIANFLGIKLDPHKWLGVIIAFWCMTLVNLERPAVHKILVFFKLGWVY